MKTKTLISGLTMLLALFASASASAVSMTLENLSDDQSAPYSEFGYTIHAPEEHLHATFNFGNNTNAAEMANDTIGMRLFKDDNGKFDLLSLESVFLKGKDLTGGTFALQIDGLVGGSAQVSKQLASDQLGTINFLSENALWSGLDEVQIWYESMGSYGNPSTFNGDKFHFDDISVVATTVVPVPAAVWLFVSAISGLGFIRKKQAIIA